MDQPETKTPPTPIVDVSPPARSEAKAEPPLAEPPKEMEFTEVSPDDTQSVPENSAASPSSAPGAAKTPEPASQPVPPSAPKPADGSQKPTLAIITAVIFFVALAAAAYYAYTKSK
jgi:hypothetical protein